MYCTGCDIDRVRSATNPRVLSVLPSSTTISSQSANCWLRIDSNASGKNAARLYVGKIMLTLTCRVFCELDNSSMTNPIKCQPQSNLAGNRRFKVKLLTDLRDLQYRASRTHVDAIAHGSHFVPINWQRIVGPHEFTHPAL